MKKYIDENFDIELPKENQFEDNFEEDLKSIEKMNKKKRKKVTNLVKNIHTRVKVKNDAIANINENHPEGSCFKRNMQAIINSLELDERAQKSLLHQYVESVTKSK